MIREERKGVGNYFEIRRENKRNLAKLFGEKVKNL
jgi:hypothetical protein